MLHMKSDDGAAEHCFDPRASVRNFARTISIVIALR
jgi:hypothetical protein